MGRSFRHNDKTREALLDAAERLLAGGGPDAISVRAVALEIQESTRAVYSVFGSKPVLLQALAARGFGFLADLINAVPATDDPRADLVTAGIAGFRTFALQRPYLFRLTFEQMSTEVISDPRANQELLRSYSAIAAKVRRAVGVLENRPLIEIVFAFQSFCHGLAVNDLSRQSPPLGAEFWRYLGDADGERLWRFALGAFVDGLRPMPR